MQTVNDIRRGYIDFFAANGHRPLASSPLVPRNDPTLMFTNAGMVQFKNVFTGLEKRDYLRAVTSQKCVRAGGKHNDLENVGYTARHHTFFEMLGNFSFGDYFKELAIELAWKLVTKEFGLAAGRLLVTVYAEDDEAFGLWRKISGLPEEKIIRIATSDNFWAMGDTGPCGPCSEIFYDHGDHIPGGPPGSANADGDRFIEIWNLVFMQYEQVTPDQRVPLPRPSIDTGMGLERVAAVMQGTHDNYRIDLLRDLILASAHATDTDPDGPHAVSHRVIADHLRAAVFLVADGVLPANEGRGYVLRRIMRRAMRHAHMIGSREPLLWRLVPTLVAKMGQAFPELGRAEALATDTLRLEETRFRNTLERGLKLLDEATAGLSAGGRLDGETAGLGGDQLGDPAGEHLGGLAGLADQGVAFLGQFGRRAAALRLGAQGAAETLLQGLRLVGRHGLAGLGEAGQVDEGEFQVQALFLARLQHGLGEGLEGLAIVQAAFRLRKAGGAGVVEDAGHPSAVLRQAAGGQREGQGLGARGRDAAGDDRTPARGAVEAVEKSPDQGAVAGVDEIRPGLADQALLIGGGQHVGGAHGEPDPVIPAHLDQEVGGGEGEAQKAIGVDGQAAGPFGREPASCHSGFNRTLKAAKMIASGLCRLDWPDRTRGETG